MDSLLRKKLNKTTSLLSFLLQVTQTRWQRTWNYKVRPHLNFTFSSSWRKRRTNQARRAFGAVLTMVFSWWLDLLNDWISSFFKIKMFPTFLTFFCSVAVVLTQTVSLDEGDDNHTEYWIWDVSDWSACKYSQPGVQSTCLKRRTVTCVLTTDWTVVAPFYCHRYASDLKPETEESCSPCERPCILSDWSAWSSCECGKRHRTRSVLYLPPDGGGVEQCKATVEQSTCGGTNATCHVSAYQWGYGDWTSCHLVSVSMGSSRLSLTLLPQNLSTRCWGRND